MAYHHLETHKKLLRYYIVVCTYMHNYFMSIILPNHISITVYWHIIYMPLTLSSQFNEFKHIRNYSAITTVLCLNIVIIFKNYKYCTEFFFSKFECLLVFKLEKYYLILHLGYVSTQAMPQSTMPHTKPDISSLPPSFLTVLSKTLYFPAKHNWQMS